MSFSETFNQCQNSKVNSELKKLHEYISPAGDNEYVCEQYYYSSKDFNTFLNTIPFTSDKHSTFPCIHFNCRSISRNFDSLKSFLSSIDFQSTAIGISETWLNDNSLLDLYMLDNYSFIANSRKSRRGGGVGLYLKKKY